MTTLTSLTAKATALIEKFNATGNARVQTVLSLVERIMEIKPDVAEDDRNEYDALMMDLEEEGEADAEAAIQLLSSVIQ